MEEFIIILFISIGICVQFWQILNYLNGWEVNMYASHIPKYPLGNLLFSIALLIINFIMMFNVQDSIGLFAGCIVNLIGIILCLVMDIVCYLGSRGDEEK